MTIHNFIKKYDLYFSNDRKDNQKLGWTFEHYRFDDCLLFRSISKTNNILVLKFKHYKWINISN